MSNLRDILENIGYVKDEKVRNKILKMIEEIEETKNHLTNLRSEVEEIVDIYSDSGERDKFNRMYELYNDLRNIDNDFFQFKDDILDFDRDLR